jgi:plastocyanin
VRRPIVGAVLAVTAALLAVALAGAAEAPSRDVTMPGKLYDPAHVSVLVGTTVTWHNGDAVNHTVTADGDAFDSGYLAAGGSFSFTFDRPGHYAYHCVIHRFMKGTVDVFSLVLTGPEAPVSAGRPVLLAGLAPAGTAAVTLRRVGADSGLVVKPRPDGSFTVRFTAIGPGAYRASVGAAVSPLVRIGVVPHVTAVRAGAALVARADPPRPGARVVLQAYDRELFGWRTIARGRLDRTSRARLPLVPPLPERVRVLVRADGGWSDGASPAIVLHG